MHIIQGNMLALPHNQMGDKHDWNDKMDNIIFKFPKRVNI